MSKNLILQDTKWIGKQRYHFTEIDSTNKKAKELAAAASLHGALVTADVQTAGVGRRGRSWSSEASCGIYMSLILQPDIAIEQAPMLTLVAALAVAKAVTESLQRCGCKETVEIKWPNDIVMNAKKICGILTEMTLENNRIVSVVIGIGINVSNQNFPNEIATTASSLYLETGLQFEKEALLSSIWKQFECYYGRFLQMRDLSLLKEEYEMYLVNKGKKVTVLEPKGEYTGTAMGITNRGELLVDANGRIETVFGGEVSVRGIYGYV